MKMINCPYCGALTEVGGYSWWQIIVSVCFFPMGMLSLLAGREPTVCYTCRKSFMV